MGSTRWRVGIGCAALLALGLGTLLALLGWRAHVDRRLDSEWRQALGGASFTERFPKVEDNATVLELERLGAKIGIDMAPQPPTKWKARTRPSPERAARFRAVSGAVKDFVAAPFDPGAAPPAEVGDFLVSVRPALGRVVPLLLRGERPVWHRDLSLGFETPVPNGIGPLHLQRLLLLEARVALRAGDAAWAQENLEAAWRLYEAMRDQDPLVITHLIAQALLKLQQPILRELPSTPALIARWRPRLTGLDLRERAALALQGECFGAHSTATSERPLGRENLGAVPVWFGRWMIWDYSRRCQEMFARVAEHDVRNFDAEAFFQEQLSRIPRWQIVARLMIPNFLEVWPKAARRELEAELTALVMEERLRLAGGGPPRPVDRKPSCVKGLTWLYAETPQAIAIRLDGDLRSKDPKPTPLRYSLRRP